MLYLNPPYHIIRGVSLLPDHADSMQWYYLPGAPKLTQIHDSETGQQVPQIQLIKYRGSAGSGGFLNFDVNLGVEEEVLDEIRSELRNRAGLRDMPRLAPVPLVDGNVKLMMLGKTSVQEEEEGERSESELFKIEFSHNAKPSLYGNNQAAFSAALDRSAVTVVEQAIQGETAPIGVVYSLQYWGLRPAYSVRVFADWNRVQHHMEESFSMDLVVVSVDINKVVDELIENRVIQIDIDTFVPEGEDESGVIGRRDQAVNQVREMVTDAFFQPSLEPIKPEEGDTWDDITDTVQALAFLNPGSCFSYKKVDITRIDRKSLNVNFRERTTLQRSIYPQGHLRGLFRVLRSEDIDLDRFVISVELDDPWFTRRQVRVISRANMAEDSISSINAQLRYGNETKTVIIDANAPEEEVSWNSILDENGRTVRDIAVQYKVTFTGVDAMERPISVTSEEITLDTDVWEINPREIYSLMTVPIVALSFPWKRYPHVEVQLRYQDPGNNIRMDDSLLLDTDNAEKIWKVFVQDPLHTAFEYKIIYRASDHKDVEGPWTVTDDERISLRDPYPNKRTLYVVPTVSWDTVREIFVDLRYEDRANNIYQEDVKQFNKENSSSEPFIVDLVNPDLRRVHFKVTLIFNDGRLFEVPPSLTREPRIYIRHDMKGHRVVMIQPDESFEAARRDIKELRVELKYEDADNGLSFSDEYRFTSPEERRYFEFDFVDANKTQFDYRITYYFTNGMSRSDSWQSIDSDELILSVS